MSRSMMFHSKIATLMFAFASMLILTNCTNNSWPQFQYNAAHSGQNAASTLTPGTAASLTPTDLYPTSGNDLFNSQIAVDQLYTVRNLFPPHRTLLFADGLYTSSIYAIDPDTKSLAWTPFVMANGSINSTPAVDDTRYVVYATDAGKLYAIDEMQGTLLWYGVVPNQGSYYINPGPSPVVSNGFVYVAGSNGHIYKFDPTHCPNNQGQCQPVWTSQAVGASTFSTTPVVATTARGNTYVFIAAFVSSTVQETYAFRDTDGTHVWTTSEYGGIARFSGSSVSSPAVLNGIVYVGSSLPAYPAIGSLRAYDGDTGTACWNILYLPVLGEINSSPALVMENNQPVAYVGTSHGLQKIDARCSGTGSTLWSNYAGAPTGYSSPVVANTGGNEVIFVGTASDTINGSGTGQLEAFDSNGSPVALSGVFGDNSDVEASPTVYGTSVYVTNQNGDIYVF